MLVTFYLNNTEVTYNVRPGEYLAETLRNHGIKSVKVGCNESTCGSCTLLVENKPVMSCSILTASIEGKHVTTVEYKNPTDEEIINYIVGNLCRCSGLQSQMNAIKAYLKEE